MVNRKSMPSEDQGRLGSDPWPENFHMPQMQPKKKKKKREREKRNLHYLPTTFCCDILLESHHIGKRLDWNQVHTWKKSGWSVPKGCLKQEEGNVEHSMSHSPSPKRLKELSLTHNKAGDRHKLGSHLQPIKKEVNTEIITLACPFPAVSGSHPQY